MGVGVSCDELSKTVTYARARLWLGITSVGLLVVIAVLLLAFRIPQHAFGHRSNDLVSDSIAWIQIIAVYVLFSLPFDVLGGYTLPQAFNRKHPTPAGFGVALLRGTAVQGAVILTAALLILAVGRAWGVAGAWVGVTAMMLLVVGFQLRLARLVAHLPYSESSPCIVDNLDLSRSARVIKSSDESFIGGLVGIPGFETLVLPERWSNLLPRELLGVQVLRREGALRTGSRMRGVILAIAWNIMGFVSCSFAPGSDVTTVAGLLTLSLWMTLWSFLGALILPTPSRAGVYRIDQDTLRHGAAPVELKDTMERLDQWQEAEPSRRDGIETIFHPVPSVTNRLKRLGSPIAFVDAYHAARMALPLSWVCLGFLGRAVHCNCGRPALWIMLPGD